MGDKISKIIPVIMAGGSGTRLWPLSRKNVPKQFLSLMGSDTMLQQTIKRVSDSERFSAPYILTGENYSFLVEDQCRGIGVCPEKIFLEPSARNTGIAIAITALYIYRQDPSAIVLLMPADHVISKLDKFLDGVSTALKAAKQGYIVTFGIEPDAPETGYGYIKTGANIAGQTEVYKVSKFVEKPDAKRAQEYIDSGEFVWNSGMFMASAEVLVNEIKQTEPSLIEAANVIIDSSLVEDNTVRFADEQFAAAPSIAFDVATMEKTDKAVVLPVDIGWSDIGSWESLFEEFHKRGGDSVNNVSVVENDTKNNVVYGGKRLVALHGVENIVVVDTGDAVLIAERGKSQDLKPLVEKISQQSPSLVEAHAHEQRSWGHYEVIHEDRDCKVKRLVVSVGKSLSYQSHEHRSEHWFVIKGTAKVLLDGKESTLLPGQAIDIPLGTKHKLENDGNEILELIEVQTGSYFGEDDIKRFSL